ncbi:MAG: hypothetical protein DWH88_00810 [Planctomycetota bacterium]|nr:MAG: hypothetical protein DWH88_00810 [Planctomycetota bacterium]
MNLAGESSFHLALLLAVSMLTAAVAGKLIGSFFHSRGFTTNGIFQEGGVTILSLLLAFLYSASLSRTALRHEMLKDECRSLSGVSATVHFLETPEAAKVRDSIRDYVDSKISLGELQLKSPQFVERLSEVRTRLRALIDVSKEAAQKKPELTQALVDGINGVIGSHTARMVSLAESRSIRGILVVPLSAVLLMLFIGFQAGMHKGLQLFHVTLFTILVSGVFWSAIDEGQAGNWFTNGNASLLIQMRDGLWK